MKKQCMNVSCYEYTYYNQTFVYHIRYVLNSFFNFYESVCNKLH